MLSEREAEAKGTHSIDLGKPVFRSTSHETPSLCYSHSEGKHSTLIKWVTTGHKIWLTPSEEA